MAKVTFGNRQARVLCNLTPAERLDLLAEGLPIILASAQGFWTAATRLEGALREARVLAGFAEEEAAKILILMDLVRCPPKRAARTVGQVVRTFYDHLGRLIYADAQSWKPVDVRQLRAYVDESRKGHCLEGYVGEYIVPNWSSYARESAMYADIEVHEDGVPMWNQPQVFESGSPETEPLALKLAQAMAAAGMFELRGLQAVSNIWAAVEFTEAEGFEDNAKLVQALFEWINAETLITDGATAEHARLLRGYWQMPMYDLNFRELAVPMEELQAQRDAQLWAETGDS